MAEEHSVSREPVRLLGSETCPYLTRPVSSGRNVSVGRVVNSNRTQFIAEAVLTDARGREIGRGGGVFVRSAALLTDTVGYAS
ncbi:MAG: hypothetical protein FHP94_12045 [Denitromonas halophila]|nr:MAG: hypothetical protein FHP94_12045 [Denitromonas halophila]TVT69136.1 MAG: hypothetical protein FHP93_14210 [Denitromonas halophila]